MKKSVGRPRNPGVEREEMRPETKWSMKARANWDDVDPADFDDQPGNRQAIPKHLMPDGMDFQWVTDTVYGQTFAEHRAGFEKRGWTPVHPEDFDGQFDGMFLPKGHQGEIRMEGQVLMARPLHLSQRAKQRDRRAALEQVAIKEAALRGGDIEGISLDTQHQTALRSNKINRSYERIAIPEE
jgi:hypothetical protein